MRLLTKHFELFVISDALSELLLSWLALIAHTMHPPMLQAASHTFFQLNPTETIAVSGVNRLKMIGRRDLMCHILYREKRTSFPASRILSKHEMTFRGH